MTLDHWGKSLSSFTHSKIKYGILSINHSIIIDMTKDYFQSTSHPFLWVTYIHSHLPTVLISFQLQMAFILRQRCKFYLLCGIQIKYSTFLIFRAAVIFFLLLVNWYHFFILSLHVQMFGYLKTVTMLICSVLPHNKNAFKFSNLLL